MERVRGRACLLRPAREAVCGAHIVGYFDAVEDIHAAYDRYMGHTALTADAAGRWLLR